MPLAPGTMFGTYEIAGLLGAGGRGEVYRARDTRLKREVALKVLPEGVAGDPDRAARFQREGPGLRSDQGSRASPTSFCRGREQV
jgi:serine/threonine protein kinase